MFRRVRGLIALAMKPTERWSLRDFLNNAVLMRELDMDRDLTATEHAALWWEVADCFDLDDRQLEAMEVVLDANRDE
ncbi:hypothetical protein ACFL51_00670 [Myxococcota bacterium]